MIRSWTSYVLQRRWAALGIASLFSSLFVLSAWSLGRERFDLVEFFPGGGTALGIMTGPRGVLFCKNTGASSATLAIPGDNNAFINGVLYHGSFPTEPRIRGETIPSHAETAGRLIMGPPPHPPRLPSRAILGVVVQVGQIGGVSVRQFIIPYWLLLIICGLPGGGYVARRLSLKARTTRGFEVQMADTTGSP